MRLRSILSSEEQAVWELSRNKFCMVLQQNLTAGDNNFTGSVCKKLLLLTKPVVTHGQTKLRMRGRQRYLSVIGEMRKPAIFQLT